MTDHNVKEVVPFFSVESMEASLEFYIKGLQFEMTRSWVVEGKIRWCWLQLGGASLMLQESGIEQPGAESPPRKPGDGVSTYFICADALAIHREITARGLVTKRPFVGNGMWVVPLVDPDGYKVIFESPTDVAEETGLA